MKIKEAFSVLAFILFMTVAGQVMALEPYADIGIGQVLDIKYLNPDTGVVEELPGPFGRLEVGIQHGDFKLAWEHTSSLATNNDKGLDFVGVTYHWE